MNRDPDTPRARHLAFGPFVLLPERQLLLRDEMPVRIGGRALEILTLLVERAGDVVSKRELIEQVWPDTVVDDGNLKVNMAALRRALGDGPHAGPQAASNVTSNAASSAGSTTGPTLGPGPGPYIATVTGRGYRFVAPVQSVTPDGQAGLSSAGPGPGARRDNLPTRGTRVFGRAETIAAIRRDLARSRLVSLVGAGGIGKTTVALAAAELELDTFAQGVWLVDLVLLKDGALVPNAVAAAIGLTAHSADMLTPLCAALRDQSLLLVIDNCEHVIDAAAACVNRLLAEAAGVKVLATSREPLLVKGERVRRLPGLAAPAASVSLDAAQSLAFPAIQLFVERATERVDAFELSDGDAPRVAEICRRLDGLALAIEFAATRVDAFGINGLLQRLDDRFRLLQGRRAGPERQRTLTATLDWSYGLLSDDEAALLRAVSVFAGVFDSEGAAAVADLPRADAAEGLSQLAAKSLLATDLDASSAAYRLLETTRSYCVDRLRAAEQEREVRGRHARHLCAMLQRAGAEWAKRPADEWAAVYGRFIDDLRGALAWLVTDEAHRPLHIRLTVAGLLLWNHFSLTAESRVHASRAVESLAAAGMTGTAHEMKLQLSLGGSTMFTRGLRPQAMAASQRALAIARGIGDEDYHLRCLMMIGIHQLFTGDHEAGLGTLERFTAVAARSDPSVLPEGETHVGIGELFLGRLADARRRLESLERRDLRYFGSYGVRYLSDPVILVRSVLSHVHWLGGRADTAMRMAGLALDNARALGHELSLNNVLSYLCAVYFWSGQYERCDRAVAQLEEHVGRHGLVARRPVARFFRAALLHVRDEPGVDAVAAIEAAIEDFRSVNHLARMPYYLGVLAEAQRDRGRLEEAEATIVAAREIASSQKEGWCLPEVIRVQAGIASARGRVDVAEALLIDAMALASASGTLAWRLRAACDLARLWRGRTRTADARHLLQSVIGEFTEGVETRDLLGAAELLAALGAPSLTSTP
ncbi:winged helix-turn-helix domain-containing protein [Mitsuaria sp. CC2]|uniref:ATP-binding protein n=1 Tax=Mitsuaria sp. CC2 TaxID=3029186 RepID=UPI003B8BBEEF